MAARAASSSISRRSPQQLGSANTYVDYAASKGAINSFTVGLGHEVAGEGIRVAGIRPGLIDTDTHALRRRARPRASAWRIWCR